MKSTLWMFCATLLLAGCFSYSKLAAPTQADVDRVSTTFPNYTLAELKQGQRLFEEKCNQCHGLKNPGKKDFEGWQKTVARMAEKANKPSKENISAADQELIVKFLVAVGSRE